MIITHENDWVIIKDYLPYCAFLKFQEGRVVETLPDLITSWSESVPINEYYCSFLKQDIVKQIQDYYHKQIKEFKEIDLQDAFRVMKATLQGHKFVDDPFAEKIIKNYYSKYIILTDHKGNLRHMLYEGGLCDQPFDFVIMYSIFKSAFAEYLAEENKRLNRPH